MFLDGIVEDLIYRNDENGYTVFLFDVNEKNEVAVGKMIQITKGEHLRLTGEYVKNEKYGVQFVFESAERLEPSDEKGIVRYLSSGLIKGVGEVTANLIVKAFGKETLEVIEFNPEKLAEIRGISRKKAESIQAALLELKAMQNAVIFLQKYDISTNLSVKIYEHYKNRTIDIVSENPYKLVEDIDGVGFLSADRIANSMGIEKNSEFRVRAGILHVLGESGERSGNTYIIKNELIRGVEKLLELSTEECENLCEEILNTLKLEGILKVFWHLNMEVVMLSRMFYTETSVSQKLALLNATAKQDNVQIDREIEEFERIKNIKFHDDQKKAVANAVQNGVSVITGGPGTGKTTIVSCVIEIFKMMGKKILLLAPTGRAAKRLSESTNEPASTIHRALEIDFRSEKGIFLYNEANPLNVNVVIVDEVSMVDISLMNNLLKALPRDSKLILIGDKDQLPSVGAGNVLSDILRSEIISVSELTKIYRQENESLIITNAHAINNGEMPVLNNKSKDFFFENQEDPLDMKNTIIEMCTTRIPNFLQIDSSKIQVLAPLKAGVCGIERLNKDLQEKLNPKRNGKTELIFGENIFREGDKVMQIANNYNIEWKRKIGFRLEEGMGVFNGDIGYIHRINKETGEILVWFDDGREAVYPKTDVKELSLAYAITIHKSQGCEFDVVIIPIVAGARMILTRNLIYTAVTRAKKMVVLVGTKTNLKKMITNTYTVKRYTMLKFMLKEANDKLQELYGE